MSLGELEEPWGQLVSTELPPGAEEERVPVLGSTFLIGRAKEADLVISGNQLVSSRHCLLHRDEEGGKWVSDTSTNGTLLNNKRLEKNKKVKLSDGDILGVVFRKDNPESNVVYKFQDLRPQSQSTEEGTQELTQEVGCGERLADEEGSRGRVVGKRREMEGDDSEDSPSAKKLSLSTDKREVDVLQEDVRSEAAPATTPVAMVKADSIEQTLICQICQEIFHDCISLQPCMHCYCSGCYSDWMSLSNECPTCRSKVERVSKNHLVNNLVDAFLRANPERKRKEEDLKELDEKNKITRDMLYPKRRRHRHYDDDDDSEDDPDRSMSGGGSSSDSDSSLPSPLRFTHVHFTLGDPSSIVASRAPPFTCRQCPGFVRVRHHSSHPPPPPFTCSLSTNHVLCMCCLQPMPDRRLETDVTIPPQTCELCGKAFCHMYWGCSKPGCSGCLGIFRDMDFTDAALTTLINNNGFESNILKDYLQSHHKTVKDMFRECCTRLDSGEYSFSDARVSSGSLTCHSCALRNLRELAYHYRTDIPNDDLPASVTSRFNCHWGRNCRTQRHNPSHAQRYNHICEQSRTS